MNQPLRAVCRAHVDALFAGFAGQDDGPPRCELTLDQPLSELKGTVYVGGRNTDYNGVRGWELRLDETLHGPHTLRLRGTDTLGNTSEKAVAVHIANRVTRPPSP